MGIGGGGGMWSAQYCSFDKHFSKPQPTDTLSIFCMKIRALEDPSTLFPNSPNSPKHFIAIWNLLMCSLC